MKKIILTMVLAVSAVNMYAQIAVDGRGHVAIGHTTPRANLDMTRVGIVGDSGEVCINFYSKNPSNKNIALKCRAVGGSLYACGIAGFVDSLSCSKGTAIYGSSSNSIPNFGC